MNKLSKRAVKTLIKIGDVIIPKNEEFPAFSEVFNPEQLNEVIKYAPEEDIKSLNTFLTIMSFAPNSLIKWFVKFIHENFHTNAFYGPIIRELNIGLRGIIFSCYYTEHINPNYSGKKPLQIINANITRIYD